MNVFPKIPSLGGSRPLRQALMALMFLLPALVSAQEVSYTAPGTISLAAVPPIYNGKYAIQETDFGFLWLDTTSLQPGLVQVEAKCGTGQPASDTSTYVIGDCNGITNVSTSGTLVVGRQYSGQCGAATLGCNGQRVDGTGLFFFRLGTFEYLGQNLADIPNSTQSADQQGRTWIVQSLDTTGRHFKWKASGSTTAPPLAGATATNVSAASRTDKTNYYGDKWQLVDTSTPNSSITRDDWDFNYNGTFSADETGAPATEGTVTGYFPCDPNGFAQGNIRTGANCIQSLGLTNPPTSNPYRFALQSANVNGTSATPYISPTVTPVCPQASIVGYAGFTGTCFKTAGTLNVLTGGNADASGSKGNASEASFNWDFTGSTPISVSGANVTVPNGATGFTLTITFPGGYQAKATGNIVQASLVAAFSLSPNPVLLNSPLTLTNQMQKAGTTTLNSVDSLVNPGACGAPPPIGTNPVGGTFLSGGTATVNAPSSIGTYCMYLKYAFTPQGQAQQTQIVSNQFIATDWQATPFISINPLPLCGNALCPQIGKQYSLSDSETFPVSPHPGAQWDLNGSSIGTSADAAVPITWTPSSTCANCTLRVTVNGATATLPVTVGNPVPTTTQPPSPTPTPTSPPSGGTVSVSVTGPSTGSRNVPLTFNASARGGVAPYNYSWACNYNAVSPIFSPGQQTQTCSYPIAGTYTVVVKAVDGAFASGYSFGNTVTVGGLPGPSSGSTLTGPALTINQFNGRYGSSTGSPVTFTATETESNAASFTWDFGDGIPAGSGRTVTHTYNTAGSYIARLTVAGNETTTSGTASGTVNLDVTGPSFRASIVPGAAHLDDGTTTWGTDVSITNGGTAPTKIGLAFVPLVADASGPTSLDLSQLDYGDPIDLAPGGSYSVSDVVAALNGGNNKGTLVIKYEGGTQAPLVSARVYFQPKVNPGNISYGSGIPAYEVDGAGRITPQGFVSTTLSQSPGGLQTNSETEILDVTLTVSLTGSGSGTVTSDPAGISCPATCSASFPVGTPVQLYGSAAAGSTFAGILPPGCDSYVLGQCTLTMLSARTVTAQFDGSGSTPTPTPSPGNFTLSVARAGAGTGTVSSAPAGISCGSTCSAQFAQGTSVTLTAAAGSGSLFSGWSGACAGTGSCAVTLSANASVTATFASAAAPTPSPQQGDQVLIGLRSDPRYRFVVTLFNAGGSSGDFELRATDDQGVKVLILDATGNPVASRKFSGLGPYQQVYLKDSDLGLDNGKHYVLKANSTKGTLLAFGTALDRKTNDLVQISDDSQASPAQDGIVSYWVAGVSRIDSNAHWRTDLRIFNRGSKLRKIYFQYAFTSDGLTEKVARVDEVPIAAGEQLTYDDVVGSLLSKDTTVDLTGTNAGILRIYYAEDDESASRPLVIGSRNYDDQPTGTAGTQLAMYTLAHSAGPGQKLYLSGAEDSDRYGSRIGVFAMDDGPVTGWIVAVAPDGSEVGSVPFTLGGSSPHYGQIALTDPNIGFNNPGKPVSIRIERLSGGRVGAYAFTVDKVTLDTNFIQALPQN